jgi:hypothetical protein
MLMLKGLRGIGKSGAHLTMQGNSTGKDTRVKKFHSVSDEDQKIVVSLGFNSVGFYARTVHLLFLSHLL